MSLRDQFIETVDPECTECPEYGFLRAGYFNYSSWSFVTITIFNAAVSSLLILLGAPVFLLLGLAIKLQDGGPFLYKGLRLGLGKRPFYMYKFRTLPVGSQRRIGPELLAPTHGLVTPFGKFLRDTRLDELPQLFNILKGDMDFVGPRPMRPEVYEAKAKHIKNIDLRFSVRPGLIGYAQLFTPHSAPKRIRALIDYKFLYRRRSRLWDIIVIGYTMLVVAKDVAVKGSKLLWTHVVKRLILRTYRDLRKLERVQPGQARVYLALPGQPGPDMSRPARLEDINDLYLRLATDLDLARENGGISFLLEREVRRGGRWKRKRARCSGTVFRRLEPREPGGPASYIIQYEPLSPLNKYAIDQYFFDRSIV
ncbi:MAG: sugar transferase [Thermodesulfobacteriota bacterium]